MTLARCAERTSRIGLGPGVLIPSLRHPMTAAASIAGLEGARARTRVVVGVGSGFTGRLDGARPLARKSPYVRTVQALLRGEQAEWEDAVVQMLHPEGFGARVRSRCRGSSACRGRRAKRSRTRSATARSPCSRSSGLDRWCNSCPAPCARGRRRRGSERGRAAAGPAVAVLLHGSYEQGALDAVPGRGHRVDRCPHPAPATRPPPRVGDRTRSALHHRRAYPRRAHLQSGHLRRSARGSRACAAGVSEIAPACGPRHPES